MIITYLDDMTAASVICATPEKMMARYVWIVVTMDKERFLSQISAECSSRDLNPAVVVFDITRSPLEVKVSLCLTNDINSYT